MSRIVAQFLAKCCLAIFASATLTAHAQHKPQVTGDYPNRPIRLIVGFPPGGGSNTMARLVANKFNERWGSNVIVDNRPGANGLIAIQTAAHAVPDGYTIYFSGNQVATAMLKQEAAAEIKFHQDFGYQAG